MIEQIVTSMPMFVCGVLAMELLFSLWRSCNEVKVWLLLWAVTATVLYACHFVFFRRMVSWLPFTDSIYVLCNLAVYPLYLIYIYKATDERPPTKRLIVVGVIYASLAAAASVAVYTIYQTMTDDERRLFFDRYLYSGQLSHLSGVVLVQALIHHGCKLLFAVGVVLTVYVGGRRLKRYNEMVDQFFADTDDKSLRGLTNLLIAFLVVAVVSLVVNFLGRQWFVPDAGETPWLLMVPSVAFSVLLCAIGYLGLQQQFTVADMTVELAAPESSISESSSELSVADAFVQLMDRERLFLEPDLRLDTVVKRMNTNRTYLLQALNRQLGMSFTEYVNRRRIEYACRLMTRNPNITRQEVATLCGYNTSATFYRNYHKYAVDGLI